MPRLALTVRLNVAVEDAEHVGRRAADVHADHVDVVAPGDRLQDVADGARRRHDRRIGPLDQLVVARRLRHDVFEEQVVNRIARRAEVLALEHGPQVVDDRSAHSRRRASSARAAPRPCCRRR